MKKVRFVFALIMISLFAITSCIQENEPIADPFEEVSLAFFESVSEHYPKGDVIMTYEKDENGHISAIYSLTGESKEYAAWGSFAKTETLSEDGTTCDGAISCGKALKKCLDNNQKGVIKNGACFSDEYCVTCEDE